jgi:hypothetical protein
MGGGPSFAVAFVLDKIHRNTTEAKASIALVNSRYFPVTRRTKRHEVRHSLAAKSLIRKMVDVKRPLVGSTGVAPLPIIIKDGLPFVSPALGL